MSRPWLTTEERIVRDHYPVEGVEKCVELLRDRSPSAIYAKARQLGVKAPPSIGRTAGKRFVRKWESTPQIDQMIRDAYAMSGKSCGFIRDLATRVGRPKWWVTKRAVAIGCTKERIKPLPWSREELALLEKYSKCVLPVIARKLRQAGFRRTETAIAVQLKRQRIDRHDPDVWCAGDLGPLLGVDPKTVCDWIERRGLPAKKAENGHMGVWRITRQGLRKWIKENHGFVDLRRVDQPWFWDLVL